MSTASNFAVIEVDTAERKVPLAYVIAFRLSRVSALHLAEMLTELNQHERKRSGQHKHYSYHVVDLETELPLTITLHDERKWQIPAARDLEAIVFDEEVLNDLAVTYFDSVLERMKLSKADRTRKKRDNSRVLAEIMALMKQAEETNEIGYHDKPTQLIPGGNNNNSSSSSDDSDDSSSSSSNNDDNGNERSSSAETAATAVALSEQAEASPAEAK